MVALLERSIAVASNDTGPVHLASALDRPILVGPSRKSFIGKLLGAGVAERLPASLACAVRAVADGAQIIRTHDVAETVQAVRMVEAISARKTK